MQLRLEAGEPLSRAVEAMAIDVEQNEAVDTLIPCPVEEEAGTATRTNTGRRGGREHRAVDDGAGDPQAATRCQGDPKSRP